jgi:hypothetical protein
MRRKLATVVVPLGMLVMGVCSAGESGEVETDTVSATVPECDEVALAA